MAATASWAVAAANARISASGHVEKSQRRGICAGEAYQKRKTRKPATLANTAAYTREARACSRGFNGGEEGARVAEGLPCIEGGGGWWRASVDVCCMARLRLGSVLGLDHLLPLDVGALERPQLGAVQVASRLQEAPQRVEALLLLIERRRAHARVFDLGATQRDHLRRGCG
eukprot:scaffold23363_cov161-Isochrysis_galbana.AAC.2